MKASFTMRTRLYNFTNIVVLLLMMFVLKYILDNFISDSEAKTQAQGKICQVARLREESKLKQIAPMHKIEEEREKEEQRNGRG